MRHHCDRCIHGVPMPRRIDCGLMHKVSFAAPRDPRDRAWGFYRANCEDYEAVQATQVLANPPTPPQEPTKEPTR